jgi:RNA polymerase sigma-70 factor, ECF subfamily
MPERDGEDRLVARLRSGDETAFCSLVDELHSRLLVLAGTMTASRALAEDIVQETWLAVIRGLGGFEGRSSLRTWIFSILIRRGRTLAARESRHPIASSVVDGVEESSAKVEWNPGQGRRGLWDETPVPWGLEDPAMAFQTGEALEVIERAIAELPGLQRQVLVLRDIEDVCAADICNILKIGETNRRVLLHRGRAHVRAALDRYVRDGAAEAPADRTRSSTPEGMRTNVGSPGRSMSARGGGS